MKLNSKFSGRIVKNKDGSIVPDDQWVVLLAKDDAVPATLEFYRNECVRLNADKSQVDSVDALLLRVFRWRSANQNKCKVPDVEKGEIQLD